MTTHRASTEIPPEPPAPPRGLTAAARRRSLLEPRVRFWWLAGLALLAASVYFAATRAMNWVEEVRIVRRGTPVTAVVQRVGQGEVEGQHNLSPSNPVTMLFEFKGKPYYVSGYLEGRQEPISLKDKVSIKIDPADPERWTYRADVPPMTQGLVGAVLVAPFAAGALAVSYLLRGKVLSTLKNGRAVPFVVVDTKQTALAPLSRTVRCTPLEGVDRRLTSVFVPMKLADPRPGDVLWLIHPPNNPKAAIPALVYV